jgi:HipA-like C-terminal domain
MTKKEMMSPYRDGLPTRFVRVGRRGATWDLPRRFKGYQASDTHEMSMAGAATKCFLSKNGSLDGAYIAKFAHKNGHLETYTELFNNQLGVLLGFSMAHSGIAKLDGVLHFLSRSFRVNSNQQLLHGSFLLQEIGLAEQAELDVINTAARQQGIYDIDLVRTIIFQVCGEYADNVFESFVEMLMFDALIGSMDRHPRNWGVLRSSTLPTKYSFAPLYDSARALLWDRDDVNLKLLESSEQDFQRYVQRSYPRIGLPRSAGCKGKCTHGDLISYLLAEHRDVTLRAYSKISVDVGQIAARLLREYPFRRVFSKLRARMVLRLLAIRQQFLLHLIS